MSAGFEVWEYRSGRTIVRKPEMSAWIEKGFKNGGRRRASVQAVDISPSWRYSVEVTNNLLTVYEIAGRRRRRLPHASAEPLVETHLTECEKHGSRNDRRLYDR